MPVSDGWAVPAIHVAADDGAPEVVRVLRDRHRLALRVAAVPGLEALGPLERAPAEVEAQLPVARDVDLLDGALPDVADPQVARRAVDRQPPRVAEAECADLRRRLGPSDERVVGRDGVRPSRRPRRRPAAGSCPAASRPFSARCRRGRRRSRRRPCRRSSLPVASNASAPPLWFAYGCSIVSIGRSDAGSRAFGVEPRLERRDDRVAGDVRVVDEEPGVVREVRVEGEAQQAPFAAATDLVADVEERRRRLCRPSRPRSARPARRRTGGRCRRRRW